MLSTKNSTLNIFKYLVEEKKINLNNKDIENRTALMLSSKFNHLNIVEYLIKNEANVN